MIFSQLEFPIFLAIVLAVAWASRDRLTRHVWLLLASYYFYAYWDYRFCGLLAFSTVVDFAVARAIDRTDQHAARRRWLLVSIVTNLGLLGFFKYYNFFVDSAIQILSPLGVSTQTLNIILPVGISFYTFQTLSYTIDVYRRRIKSVSSFVDFALYVAFFPQLVAGPIVRARELLPQLAQTPVWSKRRFYGGLQLMLRGTVKKVLLADRLGEMVDVVFAGPEHYSATTLWLAAIAYAGQIYYDFSGYSDIAIGVAKMLGYRFPMNFRHPYVSFSLTQFWHRWHMTLSRWLRDYVYIPLGGNRCGVAKQYRNLMITMLLGGLWHGAAWTFVAWGFLHGLGLMLERRLSLNTDRFAGVRRPLRWSVTMLVVLVAWILFRSPDFATAALYLHRMFLGAGGITWLPPLAIGVIVCMVLEHLAWTTRLRRWMRLPIDSWFSPIATTVLLWALVLYAPRGFRPFVYFQF